MFEIQNYASFILAVLVFQLIPGPGTIAILNATARNGVRAGLAAMVGTLEAAGVDDDHRDNDGACHCY
jgi:threonine/homoserine/homoserine lactone efflux protein